MLPAPGPLPDCALDIFALKLLCEQLQVQASGRQETGKAA